eukprot:25664_1
MDAAESESKDCVRETSPGIDPGSESIATEKERSDERLKTLEFWRASIGKKIDVHMHDSLDVSGTLLAVDGKQTQFLVADLQTPVGVYAHAVLRRGDIVSYEVKE